jgi:DNA-binding LytR/AlgR family response regulator
MNELNCLIVDDEPLARKVLREYIEDVEFLSLAGEAESPISANNTMSRMKIDLLFLDIQMPKISGLDFLKNLPSAPMTVMTTAYPEYALQGFELDVLDYLVKPIGFDRFLKAVNKAKDFHELRNQAVGKGDLSKFFFVKCDQKLEKINLADVLYVEALSNYVIINTEQRRYVTYLTLKGIEEKLPKDQFVRIHKSYLVSLNAVISIEDDEVQLRSKDLPISKHYRAQILDRINPNLFKR